MLEGKVKFGGEASECELDQIKFMQDAPLFAMPRRNFLQAHISSLRSQPSFAT